MSDQITVVAAAIIDDASRLLAAQRARPPRTAGMWEFPGGKVEPGERDEDALIRECKEELDVTVELGERFGEDIPIIEGRAILRVWLARIASGTPRAIDHLELRWLASHELGTVPWLPVDAPLIDKLRQYLNPDL
ncbi:MAG TPA: (deoxy)nucleoside triphosphate pyrophosphohydrolase [Mycobacteriales bacterium]|nr:(deoxy)nucleoside triphosphate pyrophosphohydrolase [Mycobacteriales bacterium]